MGITITLLIIAAAFLIAYRHRKNKVVPPSPSADDPPVDRNDRR